MESNEIKNILPHRYPFLLVDRVIRREENSITAIKNVTINEPFFAGHFPDFPLMPGVLLCEALAQTAGILLLGALSPKERENKLPLFLGLDKVRFRRMVRPGDTLEIECRLIQKKGNIFRFQGEIRVEKEFALTGEILLGFKEK
jgi:3-hydroxyacyl-[acyl-carrier-protein] dehydratase|uniref:3-hydroxyacyl-[acyl-carrier-protein] dehydratase FabZ n=1 Tax=candidate division WOR-3 bacterium TaxID=2052148 RepID=A0A7C3UVS7_UNCW3